MQQLRVLGSTKEVRKGVYGTPGGLLNYDLGRVMPLRLESRPIFIPNFAEK